MKAQFVWFEVAIVSVLLAGTAGAQATTRISVDSGGVEGNDYSHYATISADGRYVAFMSYASNLVPGDTNGVRDAFVHDRQAGTTERVSVDSGDVQASEECGTWATISADARYVVFSSLASALVSGDTNLAYDIFVRDRLTSTTELISLDSSSLQTNASSDYPAISGDNRYVAFMSWASNLVPGDTNGIWDVFVRDRQMGTTERMSVSTRGVEGDGESGHPSISADGRYVAFYSFGTTLVSPDTNQDRDVFVRDRQSDTTERVSVSTSGVQGNSGSGTPSISTDGRYVAFHSNATNLVPNDSNGCSDVFVHDRLTGTTERVSVDSNGAEGNSWSSYPSLSANGRYVAFSSMASNLVPGDSILQGDVFVHDRQSGTTTRVSIRSDGVEGDDNSNYPSISADGRCVAFDSIASTLVQGDTNDTSDVFVHDRGPGFAITPFCFGDGSVGPCACDNLGQPGHGCDNSISTGGALLSGSGQALLSADTLLLTASNERPTAFSLFWQGGTEIAPRVFGDGVGCMGPPLKRMYGHNAAGGTVTVPQGADLSVSARSAAVGDPIAPGSIRVYHVFYRDPDPVFCPSPFGSTFNTTNGVRVLWGS
jgi:Tol biopolymer transport system component